MSKSKSKPQRKRVSPGTDGLRESMAELKSYADKGMSVKDIVGHLKKHDPKRVHESFIPSEPGDYPPAAVAELRKRLAVSQAIFARAMGVSCVLVQGWEQGVRKPSKLARRLLDTVTHDPDAWMEELRLAAKRTTARAG